MPDILSRFVSSRASIYAAYAACALIWGTGWFAVRLSVTDGGFPLLSGAAIRYTIAAIVLTALIPMFPKAFSGLNKSTLKWIVVAGLINATGIALLYWGEVTVSGGLAAVLSATSPIIAAMLAFFTRAERITFNTVAGFVTALIGVAVIFGERLVMSPSHVVAMISVLGSALMFSLANLVMKMKAGGVSSLQSALVFFVSMSLVFLLSSGVQGQVIPFPLPLLPSLAILFLALFSSVVALPAFFYLLRRSSLMFASTLAFVHPIVALLTDALFERNFSMTTHAYVGMGVVMGGLLISMMKQQRIAVSVAAESEVIDPEATQEAYAN
ncbi:MAG: EamA family transporter [Candidatus Obscuribacterales bacterium]|nr:EamA family transporter [Candidatus Obscuribacterales bacterium]